MLNKPILMVPLVLMRFRTSFFLVGTTSCRTKNTVYLGLDRSQ